MKESGGRRKSERGVALVSVLWVVLLLSIVAASMVAGSRANGAFSSATYDRARAETVAEAGVAQAILALLDARLDKHWTGDDTPYPFSFSGAAITITIQDETGKIDLNTANDELIRSLFKSIGLSDDAADGLFDKIADWRDEDDLVRLSGAEANEYREKSYPYGPRNAALDSIDELKEVMDVTPDVFEKVKPAVTVYSSRDSIDPSVAQADALRALSQMISGKADALFADQKKAGSEDAAATPLEAVETTSMAGKAFTIHVEVHLDNGTNFVLDSVVRLTGNPRQPFWILRSRQETLP